MASVRGASKHHSYDVKFDTLGFASRFFKNLDTAVGRELRGYIRSNDHPSLLLVAVQPQHYSSVDVFWRDWCAVNLLSKFPGLCLNIDTAQVALDGFVAGEEKCRITNKRLLSHSLKYDTPTTGISGDSLIESARQKIQRVLGDFSWDLVEPFFGFSSGASTRLRRVNGDAYYKYQGKPDVTPSAALLGCCAIEWIRNWSIEIRTQYGLDPCNWVNVVAGNRITTVPKNAKTDRVIAIEPDLNMYLQRGIGGFIRQRLKRVRIDLDDQTINQRLALEGSIDGSLATLDLKAASDTISTELVRRLIPADWFDAMDRVRSKCGTLPSGEIVNYQKFSSMGNGFTFELESLIFWALSLSVVETCAGADRRCSVYGDDIIVPTAASGFLIELLDYVGFEVNSSKSFISGPFRESCGKHYFHGIDVTPFYIRKPIKDILDLFWLANSIRRWSSRTTPGFADSRFLPVWERVLEALPRKFVRWIPDGYGDSALIGTFAEARPSFVGSMFVSDCFTLKVGKLTQVWDVFALIKSLRGLVEGVRANDLLLAREKRKIRKSELITSRWTDAPNWCVFGAEPQ